MAVAGRVQKFQATHFLGLPLYNSKSKSQLESFAHKLRNDEYAEGIPRRAFLLPTSFHICVANLRLETNRDVKAASNLLRRLDIQCILKDSATATVKIEDPSDQEDSKTGTRRDLESLVSPLQVSFLGVERPKSLNPEKAMVLYGGAHDPSDRIRGLNRGVRLEFASAGFRMFSGLQDNEEEFVESMPPGLQLLSSRGVRKFETFMSNTGTIVRKRRRLNYDATLLFQRYKNVEIARDIIIEKLSLYKEGRKRTFRGDENEFVVEDYYEEVDSIPLPQET